MKSGQMKRISMIRKGSSDGGTGKALESIGKNIDFSRHLI